MSQVIVIEKEKLSSLISEAVQKGYAMAKERLGTDAEYPPNMRDQKAAKYLGVAASTMRNWRSQGIGPKFTKQGKIISYARTDLDAYIAKNKVLTYVS